MLRYPSSFSQHPLAKNIDRARHSQFMKDALPHLIGGLLTSCLIYWVFQSYAIDYGGLIWLMANLVLLSSTIVFYSIYYLKRELFSQQQWSNVILLIATIWGAAWSLPPYLFLNTDQVEYIALMLIIISMLTTTPAPAMVHYISAYYAFMSLPMLALFLKLLNSDLNILLIIFMPFLWLTQLAYSWQLHGTMIKSIRLGLENNQSRKEAERASLAKSKFIAAASHDIRQPLQAVNLFVTILKDQVYSPEVATTFQQLESSTDSMSDLLNSLLDVSRLDADTIEPHPIHLDLALILKKTQQEFLSLALKKHLTLSLQCDNLTAFADPILLTRVLNNLVSNAIRYTSNGTIEIIGQQHQDKISIIVKDTGQGIPKEEQQEIFTEFHQLNNPERNQEKGLGLGLSIVKRLCQLQKWPISLESQVNQGSCFNIAVPQGETNLIVAPKGAMVHSNKLVGVKIIIIDDDKTVRVGLRILLESWQCQVKCFDSSALAISQLEDKSWQPQLILSDYRLRENETGNQAINIIQQHFEKKINAILLTGDTDPERIKDAKKSGFMLLHKPIKPAQLRMYLQRNIA
jgi:signal transduction histidine kinase